MAQAVGGDLVLQLLQEFREHQQDYKGFKQDYLGFKQEMLEFKHEMLEFKQIMGVRMDLLQQANTETLGYLKYIVKILQPIKDQLGDHEQRLKKLEET